MSEPLSADDWKAIAQRAAIHITAIHEHYDLDEQATPEEVFAAASREAQAAGDPALRKALRAEINAVENPHVAHNMGMAWQGYENARADLLALLAAPQPAAAPPPPDPRLLSTLTHGSVQPAAAPRATASRFGRRADDHKARNCGHSWSGHNEYGCFFGSCECVTPKRAPAAASAELAGER